MASPTRTQGNWAWAAAQLQAWPMRRWLVAGMVAPLAAVLMGVPTGLVHTSLYTRMLPATWWDYPIWVVSAGLIGLLAATYVRAPDMSQHVVRGVGGGVLSTFAIGCPICNKIIVALIGVSGALTYWAPLQPLIGVVSLLLLAATLAIRLRSAAAVCTLPRR